MTIPITNNSNEREIKLYLKEICVGYRKGDISLHKLSQIAGNIMYSIFTPKTLIEKVSGELFDFIWMLDEHEFYYKRYLDLKKKIFKL